MINISQKFFIVIILLISIKFYYSRDKDFILTSKLIQNKVLLQSNLPEIIKIKNDVIVENYFEYLDSIVQKYDTLTPYKLTEHLLVRANPWIIDTLQNTDYYRMKARDSFVYDQKK